MPSLVHMEGDGMPAISCEPLFAERSWLPVSLSGKDVMIGARTIAGTPVKIRDEWAYR